MSSSSRPFAVVTGASSGIGRQLAAQFAQNGYDLLIIAQSAAIDDAATALRDFGGTVDTLRANLATLQGVDETYAAIKASGRAVDALALNAGVGVAGPFLDTDMAEEQAMIDLNITAPTRLAKFVLRDMKARGQGRVLFTASTEADTPGPFMAVYAASKAYVLSLAVALRNELKDSGITITALQPGATDTNFFHRAHAEDTKVGQSHKDDPAEVAKQAFDALMAGKESVVAASLKSKLMDAVEKIMPDAVNAEMHRSMAKPQPAKKAG